MSGLETAIAGRWAEPMAPVVAAFAEGFDSGREVGAALAVCLDGELVVDIWAGYQDRERTRPWGEDTLSCLFSISKAVTALCIHQAVAEGLLQLDRPVAVYWPEFAVQGKEAITLRHLLSHQAGLVGFHEPVPADLYYDWSAATAALARETPWWPPGTAHGYHARTFGFLLGEVLRRVSGQVPSEWFRERIGGPAALDFHMGIDSVDLTRCADMLPAKIRAGDAAHWPEPMRQMMTDMQDPATPTGAAFQNPSLGTGYMNSDRFRQADLPSMGGHGTARAVARLFQQIPELLPEAVLTEALRTHSLGPDRVLKSIMHYGLGFLLHHEQAPLGIGPGCFGHAGAGGSLAFGDPARSLGVCFSMNQMQEGVVTGGTTANAICRALEKI